MHGVQAAGGRGQMETQMYTRGRVQKNSNRRLKISHCNIIVLLKQKLMQDFDGHITMSLNVINEDIYISIFVSGLSCFTRSFIKGAAYVL